jgi:uncharacterized coiled-coil protein SlyX
MYGLNIDPNNIAGNPNPDELRELGVQMVRYTFYDSSHGDRLDPDQADFYRKKIEAYHQVGIRSMVLLSYDTYPSRPAPEAGAPEWDIYIERFALRANQIAKLLAPWQPTFQIWNEPDHPPKGNYLPTLREPVYGRMLRRTYNAIKSAAPNALIATAGLAMGNPQWLRRLIESQGGNLPADVIAIHPYGQRPAKDWPRPDWGFGYWADLMLNYYRAGQHRPLWITEMGVKEDDLEHNGDKVADFLNRFYQDVSRFDDKVKMLFWFCYSDGMVAPFGLIDNRGNRKPAYFAYHKAAAGALVQPEPPHVEEISPPPPPLSPVEIPAATAPEVAQIANQVAGLQGQLQQMQQQFTQLQNRVQQLEMQTLPGATPTELPPAPAPPPVISTPPVPPPAVPKPPPIIENITSRLKRHPTLQFETRGLNQIRRIIIHHTAIPPHIGAERIANFGVDKKEWPGIRYHYFITDAGQIQQTNELVTLSTHAGPFSAESIGIGFAGDFTNAIPAPAQLDAAGQLLSWLIAQFGLSVQDVAGYKELVNTQSPGLQWDSGMRWKDLLMERIQANL